MKRLIILFLVLVLLLACAVTSVLLARGWFTLRTTNGVAPPAPTVIVVPGGATPTLAALPPIGATPAVPVDPGVATVAPVVPAGGGFNGVYSGTLNGDNGSVAPATLTLTQTGDAVSGRLAIGEGLLIDGGTCGTQAVPAGDQNAAGTLDPANPNHLQTTGSIPVAGFTIGVTLTADLAADGQTLTARADLDLPFLCGADPAISGTFTRQ